MNIMKPINLGYSESFKKAIFIASIALFVGSCNSSKSDPAATVSVESQTSQSAIEKTEHLPANSENSTPEPSEIENDREAEIDIQTEETEEEIEIVELPDFNDETPETETSQNIEEVEEIEAQPEITEETIESVESEVRSTQTKPSIDVETFDFQLRQVSLEKEIVDRASNKRLSADNAEEPSSYLFVELDLKNNSDETMWDSVIYTLDCGDGNIIKSAADVAQVYRSNRDISIVSEIQPGGKGLVADAFLVPEYCLKSDRLNLVVSPVGKGKATIPLNVE